MMAFPLCTFSTGLSDMKKLYSSDSPFQTTNAAFLSSAFMGAMAIMHMAMKASPWVCSLGFIIN